MYDGYDKNSFFLDSIHQPVTINKSLSDAFIVKLWNDTTDSGKLPKATRYIENFCNDCPGVEL